MTNTWCIKRIITYYICEKNLEPCDFKELDQNEKCKFAEPDLNPDNPISFMYCLNTKAQEETNFVIS